MKPTLAENNGSRTAYNSKKKWGSFDDQMSREMSKEGHANPFKVKTAIFRNSITLNNTEQSLSLHGYQQINSQSKDFFTQQLSGSQTERKQDHKRIKSQSNPFQKGPNPYQFTGFIKQNPVFNHSRRLSQQPTGYNYSIDLQQKDMVDEKQNKFLLSSSMINDTASKIKNTIKSFAQKNQKQKYSQISNQQPSFYDSSLTDQSTRLGLTTSKQDPNVSLIKDQILIIVKRLEKNQSEIETLKRDKSVDIHMEKVWKQISTHSALFEKIQQSFPLQIDQKLATWQKDIEKVKSQLTKQNQQQRTTLKNEMKELQSKMQLELKNKLQKRQEQNDLMSMSEKENSRIKKELSALFHQLFCQLNTQVESRFKGLRMKNENEDKIQEILKTGRLNISPNKAMYSISLLYKEVLRVNSNMQQPIYSSCNSNDSNRISLFSRSSSPNRQKSPSSPRRQFTQQIPQRDIQINQVQYFIDEKGFLLDKDRFYILTANNQPILLDDKMIQRLKNSGILKKENI